MTLTIKARIEAIKAFFLAHYSQSKTELVFRNDYELLIAIILSAQCTDKRVNLITPELFKHYPSTKELSVAPLDDVKKIIGSCSFFNNKAKHIVAMAIKVETLHGGVIPKEKVLLEKLDGVGNKTANVFLIESQGVNKMAVDTHVFRVSHRLGLSSAKDVFKTEQDLVKKFKDNLNIIHQGMVLFGRYHCTAKKPKCDMCELEYLCKSNGSYKVN